MPRYRVASKHIVLGHKPGEEFDAELPAAQHAYLVGVGHLALVAAAAPPATDAPPVPVREDSSPSNKED